ncbi:MAG: hypothetical protein J1F36_02345 [Clostridiales bacterium]|nr:hypothetical protein [Clostridiales bacterium]
MKRELDKIIAELKDLHKEIAELKTITLKQNEEIEALKKQLASATTVKIEEDGKQTTESFGNLILDEIITIKKNLEGFSAEGLRNVVNDVAALKNKLEEQVEDSEFSLTDIKSELLKLADMMTV